MRLFEPRGICDFPQRWAVSAAWGLILAATLSVSSVRAEAAATNPLAEVNGETITAEDLDRALGSKLAQLEEQIYSLKRQELDGLIAQRLFAQEAAKRGMSVPALLDTEVTAKVGLVTEKEIEDFYQENKAKLPAGEEATVRQQIRTHLQQRKLAAQRALFLESLRSQRKVVVHLQPPPVARVNVAIDGAPLRGAVDGPVTIVEFSDFECPFCKQVHTTLAQVMGRYVGKVRLAYRDFPIDLLHPQARRAAEAGRCAQDQGRFWDYHDVLFTQAPRLAPDDLKRYAQQVGLDAAKFETCLSSDTHKAAVQKDMDAGTKLGITGTPAFFINGRPLQGAQPLEAFARVIDDELARAAQQAQ